MKLNQLLKLAILMLIISSCNTNYNEITYNWTNVVNRTWSGENFWANRIQDWEVANGKLVCKETSEKKPMRTVHLVTSRLENDGNFAMSVQTGATAPNQNLNKEASSGFLIGAGSSIDYRAAALIHHSPGEEGGYFIGVTANGTMFIQDFNNKQKEILAKQSISNLPQIYQIEIQGNQNDTSYQLILTVSDESQKELGKLTYNIEELKLKGNVALVSHPGKGKNTGAYWFNNWTLSGDKFSYDSSHNSGPIITAQYTLSNKILKINAQLMPIGTTDNQDVSLEIKNGDVWESLGSTSIQHLSYNALFKIENFNDSVTTPYRLSYTLKETGEKYYFEGSIKKNPVDKDTVIVAGFTGNHNLAKGVESSPFNWKEQIWYPHNQLVDHVKKQNPDLLFFSGDQIYERASPSNVDRNNKNMDYMYKWYLWCWAYNNITKDLPTVTIPDDHDVSFRPRGTWVITRWRAIQGCPSDAGHNHYHGQPANTNTVAERQMP